MKNLLIPALVAAGLAFATTARAEDIDVPALWKQHCQKCHGETGKGDTKVGKNLKVGDYTDPKVQEKFTDEEAVKAIRDGVTVNDKEKMKPYGEKLKAAEIEALVKYIRSMKVDKPG